MQAQTDHAPSLRLAQRLLERLMRGSQVSTSLARPAVVPVEKDLLQRLREAGL